MTAARIDLKFQIGARTLACVPRRLVRVALSLDDVLAGALPDLPPLDVRAHGYLVTSLPEASLPKLEAAGLRATVRQSYVRRYVDLAQNFDAYLASFSAKTRSTLRRKLRDLGGDAIDVRAYRTVDAMDAFWASGRAISRLTYQERLLDAGLPEGPEALAAAKALAARDAVRAYLLYHEGRPVSYLYMPAAGNTLIYANLGYDPVCAALSPGTVLQLAALRDLMGERRFARLDFTEGDGQHKRLFATGGVVCVDVLLLRPTLGNRLATAALAGFDRSVAGLRRLAGVPVLGPLLRAVRR